MVLEHLSVHECYVESLLTSKNAQQPQIDLKTRDGNIWDLLKAFSAFAMGRDNGTRKNASAKALKYYPQGNTCGTNPADMQ